MKYLLLIPISFLFMACTQTYFKNGEQISKSEYLDFKETCQSDYQVYVNNYKEGNIYAVGYQREVSEYMRECMRIANGLSVRK